jgi:two-component system, sensor histidine kinase and response regulator
MHAEPDPTETRPWAEQIASTPATSGLDQSAIQRTLQQICEQAGWPYAEAWSPSRDGTCQLLPAWYASDSGLDAFRRPTEALHFMPRVGLPSRVLRSKRVMFVADVTTDPLFCRRTAARKAGLVGAIGVPILAGETVAVVLVFFGRAIESPAWPKLTELAQVAASRLGASPMSS